MYGALEGFESGNLLLGPSLAKASLPWMVVSRALLLKRRRRSVIDEVEGGFGPAAPVLTGGWDGIMFEKLQSHRKNAKAAAGILGWVLWYRGLNSNFPDLRREDGVKSCGGGFLKWIKLFWGRGGVLTEFEDQTSESRCQILPAAALCLNFFGQFFCSWNIVIL